MNGKRKGRRKCQQYDIRFHKIGNEGALEKGVGLVFLEGCVFITILLLRSSLPSVKFLWKDAMRIV
jgi:hypothetical protein